jgi:hypothetical protein
MESNLFVELSEQQQEVVSGGVDAFEELYTSFSKEALSLKTVIGSNEKGSAISQEVVALDVFTDASKYFDIDI